MTFLKSSWAEALAGALIVGGLFIPPDGPLLWLFLALVASGILLIGVRTALLARDAIRARAEVLARRAESRDHP